MEWMILPFRRYVEFSGRSRRKEFWMFQLLNLIVWTVIAGIFFAGWPWDMMQGEGSPPGSQIDATEGFLGDVGPLFWLGWGLAIIWSLGTFIPQLAVTVRRLHDRGMSGWWYAGLLLLGFVPLLNLLVLFGYIALLVVLLLPSQPGPNRWGPDPKDPGQAAVFE